MLVPDGTSTLTVLAGGNGSIRNSMLKGKIGNAQETVERKLVELIRTVEQVMSDGKCSDVVRPRSDFQSRGPVEDVLHRQLPQMERPGIGGTGPPREKVAWADNGGQRVVDRYTQTEHQNPSHRAGGCVCQ